MWKEIQSIPGAWAKAWQYRTFRTQILFTAGLLLICSFHNFHCLRVWESRQGAHINDVVLNHLPPFDFSWAIFLLEYSTIVLVVVFTSAYPDKLLKGVQIFSLTLLARTIAVYLVPLEAPTQMIMLSDPVANFFLHSNDVFVTKDLFFSGHVSGLTVMFLACPNKHVKYYIGVVTVLVAGMILCQHVHYTMDVLFAPVVSYLVYKLVNYTHAQTKYGLELQDAN